MAKKALKKYEPALGVKSYEVFRNESLHPLLIKQYRVKGLDGMLLSPRANKNKKGYSMCTSCYDRLKKKKNCQVMSRQSLPSQMDSPLVLSPRLFLSLQDQEGVDIER
jgi:poly-D-alanine transfer protein DltD